MLHRLSSAEFVGDAAGGGDEPVAPILLVRVPRSCLRGDLTGQWMAYFSYPPGNLLSSDWVFVEDGGTALVGHSTSANPMTALRRDLLAQTREASWERLPSGAMIIGEE